MRYNAQTHYSDITVFAECPSCHKLIKMKSFTDAVLEGARNCPFCRVFISKKEVIASCQLYLITTKAMQSAGHILAMYKLLYVIFAMICVGLAIISFGAWENSKILFYLYLFSSTFMLVIGFLGVKGWLFQYSHLQTTDEDFVDVKKKMMRAQIVWVWANIVNLIWIVIFIKYF